MTSFQEIYAAAAERNGGEAALKAKLPKVKSDRALKGIADDRYLSFMSLRVFSAGLKHSMVRDKWPAFEEVFHGFEPHRVRSMPDEALEVLMGEKRIIRHWGKIKSVRANAASMCDIIDEAGSMGAWLTAWKPEQTVELWDQLSKRFTQLGGNSGPYFLRMVGKDTFNLTPYVLDAMKSWGLYDGSGKGKGQRAKVQAVFDDLRAECKLPLCQISMTLAQSVD
ncbi:MAG: DNA-3-methyladenine glycosylase I [Rhodospirillaceae bacterium]|jgi:3-methyladenine DNA glycosylase Tag|nr:DNA-3-methyladenine glycosylase I [Rhodospirillaceae bacterium]MBT4689835.1 DNA-3-methyladenine glycosylase I [Rhodospirillaceae bacterium]MBT5083729.1 DNA-3-methyladenine glycosylase I [Rhodospirillaceae bacterium]MBT5522605.1 DNA-3-methyladenine glycosylase I [Rhodospirillaceae bacterium]MBT5878649.1 DNA-3-methyladenine glycosylase I [Rhodospirillaceae bacterium]